MYVVEITEDKIDNLIDHMSKGLKYFNKAIECLEDLKEHSSMNERYEDDDYEDDDWNERYGNRGGRSGNNQVGMRRSRGGGRYSRY